MIDINLKLFNEKKEELTKFNGWIPYPFTMLVDTLERNEYLKSIGSFDKVQNENWEDRIETKTSDDVYELRMAKLKKWLDENPKFKNIIIFK